MDFMETRQEVAVGTHMLTQFGLATGVRASLGHVSVRIPGEPDKFVVKGRGYRLDALNKMRPEDLVVCNLEGELIDGPAIALVDLLGQGPRLEALHDATLDDPSYAFALSRLSTQDLQYAVTGIFRDISRPTYDDKARAQVSKALQTRTPDLQALLTGTDTWTVD